jgi:pterin-4a-carbinolamine dehydratase
MSQIQSGPTLPGGDGALRPERLGLAARRLPGWRVAEGGALERTFEWPDGAAALAFVGLAAATGVALEAAPEIRLAGHRVTVRLAAAGDTLTAGQQAAARVLGGAGGMAAR